MMNFSSFLIVLIIGLAHGGPMPSTTKLIIEGMDVEMNPNPYFGSWTGSISSSKEAVSLKAPILKDLPAEMMINTIISFGGMDLPEMSMTLCDAFSEPTMGQDILSHGKSKDGFATNCPVKASEDFLIDNYAFPPEKIPPGTPPGPVTGKLSIYEVGKDPYAIIKLDGNLVATIPSFGR